MSDPDQGGFEYDGVRFRPADGEHAPGEPTAVGLYHSRGGELWAEYAGGRVLAGRIVGTTRPDGTIDGAYCQVSVDGQTTGGTLVSVPERLPDGRIRLHENWRRTDGSSGVSVIDQVVRAGRTDEPGGVSRSAVQLEYLRDAVYRQLREHLGTADLLAAHRCAARLLDGYLAGRALPALTVLVRPGNEASGWYTLAFVRAMQLITARVHGETFTLRADTSAAASDSADRASQVLGLSEDPRCEVPAAAAVAGLDDPGFGDVDVVIGAPPTGGEPIASFPLDADTSYAPDVHRSLLADLLKFDDDGEDC